MKYPDFKTALFLICSLNSALSAQDLHIYFNAAPDNGKNLVYVLNGDTLTHPKVRSGSQIFFHVDNFNNYLFRLEVGSNREEIDYGDQTSSVADLMGASSAAFIPAELPIDGIDGLNPFPGFNLTGIRNAFRTEGNLKGYAYADNIKRIETGIAEIETIGDRVSAIEEEVTEILQSKTLIELARADLEAVMHHPGWKPAEIKKLAGKYMKQVFNTDNPNDIDAKTILKRSRIKNRLREKMRMLCENRKAFAYQSGQLTEEAAVLDNIPVKDKKLFEVSESLSGLLDDIPGLADHLDREVAGLDSLAEEAEDLDMTALIQLQRNVEGILKNNFSYTYRTVAEGDFTRISASLTPRASTDPEGDRVQLAQVRVPVYGGFKVNASVGVSFARYLNQPRRYFIQDGSIRAENEDQFSPVLTSFFHFYWQRSGNLSFGGSFGMGLPLVGAGERQSACFFLGPTIFLGRKERLALTAGVMGGRVERPANGLRPGDTLDVGEGVLPTHNPYEAGFFLGISFNMFGEGK